MQSIGVFLRWRFALPALASLLLWAAPGFATLGQDVSSIRDDQAHLNASERVVTSELYSVHEMKTPRGTTIREYVSPAGIVFAVSWRGFPPDLRQLLGEHFDQYLARASEATRRGRGVHVETGDLVVDAGGHMRYSVGRAFLSSQLPSGVSRDEIR